MAWENRNGRRYYYRKQRMGTRVISEYVGSGSWARFIEMMDAIRRDQRHAEIASNRTAQKHIAAFRQDHEQTLDVEAFIQAILKGILLTTGYYTHNREWRKRK